MVNTKHSILNAAMLLSMAGPEKLEEEKIIRNLD